jgi:hypothetical protein
MVTFRSLSFSRSCKYMIHFDDCFTILQSSNTYMRMYCNRVRFLQLADIPDNILCNKQIMYITHRYFSVYVSHTFFGDKLEILGCFFIAQFDVWYDSCESWWHASINYICKCYLWIFVRTWFFTNQFIRMVSVHNHVCVLFEGVTHLCRIHFKLQLISSGYEHLLYGSPRWKPGWRFTAGIKLLPRTIQSMLSLLL